MEVTKEEELEIEVGGEAYIVLSMPFLASLGYNTLRFVGSCMNKLINFS